MRRSRRQIAVAALTAAAAALALLRPAVADQLVREGFEGTDPLWVQGAADGSFREVAHRITDERPFRGLKCEFIQVSLESGNYVHYTYDVGRAPVTEDLKASLWIRANRPGIQLLARVVLPHEPNPARIEESTTVLVRGDIYGQAGRWQRLDLSRPTKLLTEQQQLLRAQLKHDVSVVDAYVDRLVLNVAGGPGDNQVWVDNLEIGPVLEASTYKTTGLAKPPRTNPLVPAPRIGPALVKLRGDGLIVRGQRYFFKAIRWSDTPLDVLQQAGFNTICFDTSADPKVIKEAAAKGFLVVPSVPLANPGDVPSDLLASTLARFTAYDNVLFWDVGSGGLALEQALAAGRTASLVRNTDSQSPIAVDVWDGFQAYRAEKFDMLGIHRWPLMTGLELGQYRDWLTQRRNLTEGQSFAWTWVQTHLPDWYTTLIYDRPGAGPAFNEPIGPQPEQIRLLTYTALGSGCRGLGFWSDRFLADSHTGQDRLLTLALLNKEVTLLEPLLLTSQAPEWIETSVSEVKAAVFRPLPDVGRGVLILPMCLGAGAQFVPGQGAHNNLTITLPLPQFLQVWQVSPGVVGPVEAVQRVPGGLKITLKEFDLTSAIVCTSDVNELIRLQNAEREYRQEAAHWSHDLAVAELKKVQAVYDQLDKAGHPLKDGPALLERAEKNLSKAEELWEAHRFGEAYLEAQRALRPLRILQRTCWEDAIKDMTSGDTASAAKTPTVPMGTGTETRLDATRARAVAQTSALSNAVSSPYAVSFYTLPRQYQFMDQVRSARPGANLLSDGGFEEPPGDWPPGWLEQKVTLPTDGVDLSADRMVGAPDVDPPGKPPVALPPTATPPTDTADRSGRTQGGTRQGRPQAGQPTASPPTNGVGLSADRGGAAQTEAREGKQCLRLRIKAKDPLKAPAALERTFLAVHTPAVRLLPGTLVRITGWVRLPGGIASTDGALVYDSAGGNPLPCAWSPPRRSGSSSRSTARCRPVELST